MAGVDIPVTHGEVQAYLAMPSDPGP